MNLGRILLGGIAGCVLVVVAILALIVTSVVTGAAGARGLGTVEVGERLKPGVIPQQYVGLITEAAQTCPEVTAPLLAAQIQTESNWNPDAVGPKTYLGTRARGIAQFMPRTWEEVGRDANGNGTASPFEPGDAIPAQARYMCDLLNQVRNADLQGDDINLTLAAYNAGFRPVQRYGGIPPYPETQKYISDIRDLADQFAQHAPQPGSSKWVTPVAGTCSSGFGPRWGSFHHGQDIANDIGTPIVAASAGHVIAAGPASGYGLWVKIQHPGNVVTIYGHIQRATVTIGQQIQPGQTIATLGNRGQSTGPHLHYQIETGGKPVDPVAYHQQRGAPPLCD